MVEITHADRVVFPDDGLTKGDVAAYFRLVAGKLFAYSAGRPLTVERYPKGIGQPGFMQKNAPDHFPAHLMGRHHAPRADGEITVYPVLESMEAIEYLANLGVITFHVPPFKVDELEYPDWAIWDLDPPAGEVGLVREAAWALRDLLASHDIPVVVMTSGSKGYHLRARLEPNLTGTEASGLARGIAALAVNSHPDLMTLAFRKHRRQGRVFVDWLRNAPYSTAVVPWSLRARTGAPVAAPLVWEELDVVAPDAVRLADAGSRLASDPWKGVAASDLSKAVLTVRSALDDAGIELAPFDRFRS